MSPPQLVTAADNNNRLVQEEQVIETKSREEEEAMEVKRLLPSQRSVAVNDLYIIFHLMPTPYCLHLYC